MEKKGEEKEERVSRSGRLVYTACQSFRSHRLQWGGEGIPPFHAHISPLDLHYRTDVPFSRTNNEYKKGVPNIMRVGHFWLFFVLWRTIKPQSLFECRKAAAASKLLVCKGRPSRGGHRYTHTYERERKGYTAAAAKAAADGKRSQKSTDERKKKIPPTFLYCAFFLLSTFKNRPTRRFTRKEKV